MIGQPEIIYSDSDFAVINKPAGMIVNNADTSRDVFTLQDFIKEKFKLEIKDQDVSEFQNRGGIVHRLDKETSGVIIVALNEESFKFLQQQFKDRTTVKEYLALCHGNIKSGGEINVPIGRLPWNRMRFGVIPEGREAVTEFEVLKNYILEDKKIKEELTLVKVKPKTGRTHQIRVHMQYIGHPIFADSLYAGRKRYAFDKKFLNRHFLHASKLTIIPPKKNEPVTFEAPTSSELVALLDTLK